MMRITTIAAAALLLGGSGAPFRGDPPELRSASGTKIASGAAIMSFTVW
jgi:hypothetical protein